MRCDFSQRNAVFINQKTRDFCYALALLKINSQRVVKFLITRGVMVSISQRVAMYPQQETLVYVKRHYSLYNLEIRRDVTSGRLRTSLTLRVTIKPACFTAIPYYASVSWYLA